MITEMDMKKDELRYLQRLAEILSYNRKAIYGDYQSSVNPESAEGNGTLYVRPSWRVSGVFTCAQNGSGAVRKKN